MKTTSTGSQCPDRSAHRRVSLPRRREHLQAQGLSNRIVDSIIQLHNPDRVLECAHNQRQLEFQDIVRRYISQILYGCRNPFCTTPTCLSCKKRLITKPFRPPTQLTGRALAFYLASQDDPHTSLCPHELRIAASQLEIPGDDSTSSAYAELVDGSIPRAGGGGNKTSARSVGTPLEASVDRQHEFPSDSTQKVHQSNKFWETIDKSHQAKKDVKSLGQNLFDTVAVIFSYSRKLPTSLQLLRSLLDSGNDTLSESVGHQGPVKAVREAAGLSNGQADSSSENHVNRTLKLEDASHKVSRHPQVPPSARPSTAEQVSAPLDQSARSLEKSEKDIQRHMNTEILPSGHKVQLRRIKERLPQQQLQGTISWKKKGIVDPDERGRHSPKMPASINKPSLSNLHSSRNTDSNVSPLQMTHHDSQTLSKKKETEKTGLPVTSHLSCAILEDLAKHTYKRREEQPQHCSFVVDYDKHFRLHPAKPFVNRSLYHTLSDPAILLKSFRDEAWQEGQDSPLSHLDSRRLTHAFQLWDQRNGSLVFDSLWIATKVLFNPPPELDVEKSPRLKAAGRQSMSINREGENATGGISQYLSDLDAAHIIMICIHALTAHVPHGYPATWERVRHYRSWGNVQPRVPEDSSEDGVYKTTWLSLVDALEYEPALRLADRLVRGIAARRCFSEILHTLSRNEQAQAATSNFDLMGILIEHLTVVERQALLARKRLDPGANTHSDPGWTVSSVLVEWLRTVILKKWDGKAELRRWDSAGAAVEILADLDAHRDALKLTATVLRMPYFSEKVDQTATPTEFANRQFNPNSIHILSYPFFFYPRQIVAFFRTINFTNMFKQYEIAERNSQLKRHIMQFIGTRHSWLVQQQMKETLADYVVLDVSRERPLDDAFDQLWGLQKRQLLKPLKIKMGVREGEQGLDQGGVSVEFFRVVLGEVFNTDNGMFSIDPQTQMTWFQPASLEPLYRFHMVGILFSLAIYNGITLPVTFPLAFYRRLLDQTVSSIDHIRDGWPDLARAFGQLLTWSEGDVGDVFVRTYSFSFEALGERFDVDMEHFNDDISEVVSNPSSRRASLTLSNAGVFKPSAIGGSTDDPVHDWLFSSRLNRVSSSSSAEPEASLVTNKNRDQYVKDYIYWLTDRSMRPQFEAFQQGFFTCLDKTSIKLFNAETLKTLVEGYQEISIKELKKAVHYEDGYYVTHPTIAYFWSVVGKFSHEEKKQLLEFVTATDRVPVNGLSSIRFDIVRNTSDTENLPTSYTCFGKLMLPEYSSKEKLERKLRLALQNLKGFGNV